MLLTSGGKEFDGASWPPGRPAWYLHVVIVPSTTTRTYFLLWTFFLTAWCRSFRFFPSMFTSPSLLTGVPPFDLALPSQDQRCHLVAVEEKLGDLLSIWKMPLSAEVSQVDDKTHYCLSDVFTRLSTAGVWSALNLCKKDAPIISSIHRPSHSCMHNTVFREQRDSVQNLARGVGGAPSVLSGSIATRPRRVLQITVSSHAWITTLPYGRNDLRWSGPETGDWHDPIVPCLRAPASAFARGSWETSVVQRVMRKSAIEGEKKNDDTRQAPTRRLPLLSSRIEPLIRTDTEYCTPRTKWSCFSRGS